MKIIKKTQRFRIFLFTILLVSIISISSLAVYAMQSVEIPVEVKEPLTILDYPTGFSLFPGETINFNFTIENVASVTYFQEFEFLINNTAYQKYVTFSNYNYSIPPGIHLLNAWITISPHAPQENFVISINKKTEKPISYPPSATNNNLSPTIELLAGGARWAAKKGTSALYVNWKDNHEKHHKTTGRYWPYPIDSHMDDYRSLITTALEASGFKITYTGDIPEDLTSFDLIVLFVYFAIEPHHESLIRDFIENGGGVVLLSGSPGYLVSYSKDLKTDTNLEKIQDWFGAGTYLNTGGTVRIAFDNPFGTSITTSEFIKIGTSNSFYAAVDSLNANSEPIAFWDSGSVFAFTHEYGSGRVYYQASFGRNC